MNKRSLTLPLFILILLGFAVEANALRFRLFGSGSQPSHRWQAACCSYKCCGYHVSKTDPEFCITTENVADDQSYKISATHGCYCDHPGPDGPLGPKSVMMEAEGSNLGMFAQLALQGAVSSAHAGHTGETHTREQPVVTTVIVVNVNGGGTVVETEQRDIAIEVIGPCGAREVMAYSVTIIFNAEDEDEIEQAIEDFDGP